MSSRLMPKRREAASWARRRRSLALAKVIIRPCQRLTPLHAKEQGSACRGASLVGGVGHSRGPSEADREHHSVFRARTDAVRRIGDGAKKGRAAGRERGGKEGED